jgi:hypothetical protein
MATERPGNLSAAIRDEVLAWPGVSAHRHRFGGIEFRVGRRELGHIHGNHLVDLPFPVRMREQLIVGGKAERHHILPDSGWVSYPLHSMDDVSGAIALFRLAWEQVSDDRTIDQ